MWKPLVVGAALLGLAGCGMVDLGSEATETWTKHYTLNHGGEFAVRNTNGRIEVVAGDGDGVDVTATKVARATSDGGAKDVLKQMSIKESVSPDRIALESSYDSVGFSLVSSRRVDYVVHVPRWANLDLRSTNGEQKISDLGGMLKASTTNGTIDGESLTGGAHASATNGRIAIDFAKLGGDVSCDTTNGRIALTLPGDARASLSASVTNGSINTDGLNLSVSDKSRRHLEGTINGGGGAQIRLGTTNGSIGVKGR